MEQKAHFRVDTRLASLLAETYRSSERALKELVDNAWDADANFVRVTLPRPSTNDPIVIQDDGSGMTSKEVLSEYLVVANDRRSRKGELSPQKKRRIKGKKGIGKFAGLMAAGSMTVETWARGAHTTLTLDRRLTQRREVDLEKIDLPLQTGTCDPALHGTKVVLTNLNQNLAFPIPEKLKQLLVLEYGRSADFKISVNDEPLDLEDLPGQTFEEKAAIDGAGEVRLRFTVADGTKKLKHSGIVLRVADKVVGKPSYLGLDEDETIPRKLLGKIYGELEADALLDDVTADWGAIIENSRAFQQVSEWAKGHLKEKVSIVFAREVSLAKARLQRAINARLEKLPEYRREASRRILERVLQKFYGETEERIETIVSVVLDALEHDDYWAVLQEIDEASRGDVAAFAEALEAFGLVDTAMIGRQARVRMQVLDQLDSLVLNPATLEATVHRAFEANLWLLGPDHALVASNKTLATVIEEYASGTKRKTRPDLFLAQGASGRYLLIEFKRPEHALDTHGKILAVGLDDAQKGLGFRGHVAVQEHLAPLVQDANVHPPSVEVDAAVMLVLSGVESHGASFRARVPAEGTSSAATLTRGP